MLLELNKWSKTWVKSFGDLKAISRNLRNAPCWHDGTSPNHGPEPRCAQNKIKKKKIALALILGNK